MTRQPSVKLSIQEKAEWYLAGGHIGNMKLPGSDIVREGHGARVRVGDIECIDWMMGAGAMVLEHTHPKVVEAAIEAARTGSGFFFTTENAVLLAEELVNAVPCAEKVRFTTTGSDAGFQAMRIARAYRGRDLILKFEGAYHGTSDVGLMSYIPQESLVPSARRSSGGIPRSFEDIVVTSHFNDLDGTIKIIEQHRHELAAVIIEPLQRVISPEPGFLEGVREVTAQYDIPLIFDEVVTGFRLAYGGAQEFYGVIPDLCAMGKIMGGGYPLGAVVGSTDIMSVYDQEVADSDDYVLQVGTMNGHHVACAAALATLEELRKEGVYELLKSIGQDIRMALKEICAEYGIAVQVCGENALFDVYFTDHPIRNYEDTLTADTQMMTRFNAGLFEQRILKNPLKWHPSLAHAGTDVKETIAALEVVISTLRN